MGFFCTNHGFSSVDEASDEDDRSEGETSRRAGKEKGVEAEAGDFVRVEWTSQNRGGKIQVICPPLERVFL